MSRQAKRKEVNEGGEGRPFCCAIGSVRQKIFLFLQAVR